MTENTVERRLAAILAADVAEYSRLMGADEDATMAQWWSHRREIIDPTVVANRGRIVKHTGDGFLAEFAAATDAVTCALEMQNKIAARRGDYADHKRVEFRMGINLGDIMSDDEDIYGDGVNIAARIEALAEPGGVLVSGSVYEQIRSKPGFACDNQGDHSLKNIADPVRVYRVQSASAQASVASTAPTSPTQQPNIPTPGTSSVDPLDTPSIAVLPFNNMSGDPEQEYFADGITEDLITDLSKFSGLLVIARNSVFTYKGKAVNVVEVCRELGVHWALEGSVRKSGNRVRINAQLIDGISGGHIWAERYDRDLNDIFAVQDEVTGEIISALQLKFTAAEERRLAKRGTTNTDAYDALLRARELIMSGTQASSTEARGVIQTALEADASYATAMAGMAMTYVGQYVNQWGDDHRAAFDQAIYWAEKAIETDPDDATAQLALGVVRIWQNRLDDARVAAERLIELRPGLMDGPRILANIENFAGNPERAAEMGEEAMRRDPHSADMSLHVLGQCYFALQKFEMAADLFRRRIARNPNTDSSYVFLAGCYGQMGRYDEAREQWAHVFEVKPDYSLYERARLWPFKKTDVVDLLYEGLEKAGIDPGPKPER